MNIQETRELEQLTGKIKPIVTRWINDKIAQVNAVSGGGMSAHDIGGSLHTGTLSNSQAPQFLLRDGGRSLLGNLAVAASITIDGVDIDVFKSSYDSHVANPDAHHARFTSIPGDTGTATPNAGGALTIIGGNGVGTSASGNALTVNLDTPTTLSVSTTNATTTGHTHAITSSNNPGATASILASGSDGSLYLDTNLLAVDGTNNRVGIGMTPTGARLDVTGTNSEPVQRWLSTVTGANALDLTVNTATTGNAFNVSATGLTTGALIRGVVPNGARILDTYVSGDTQPRMRLTTAALLFGAGGATAVDSGIRRTASGELTIDNGAGGAVDLIVTDRITAGQTTLGTALITGRATTEQLRLEYDATNYASFIVGAGGNLTMQPTGDLIFDPVGNDILPQTNYDLNLGALNRKYLTLHAAELWVETLVAQDTIATIGGRILVGATTQLSADIAAVDTSISVKHNQMRAGDVVYLEANGKIEFMSVVSGPTGTGPYAYTVTRNLDGTGANIWNAGDAVFNTGQAGTGFIDLYSLAGVNGLLLDAIHAYDNGAAASPFEGGTYGANLAQENGFQLFPNSLAVNDAMYFGFTNATWNNIYLNIVTAASWTGVTAVWEYWDGTAWTSFTPTVTGAYTSVGGLSVEWTLPLSGWSLRTINTLSAYWVRNRITAVTSVATYPRQGTRRVYWRKRTFGPTITGNVRNSTTFNDWSPYWAIGNLNGLYDYGNDTFGFAAGRYGGALGTTPWISADATNGFRVVRGSTVLGQWDTSGVVRVGEVAPGRGNVLIDSGGVRLRTNTTVAIDAQTDGDILIGTNTTAPPTTFFSLFSTAQTYNSESMAVGDVLIGDNSASRANIKWTPANGRLNFRGGTTTQLYINTDGSLVAGDKVFLNSNGLSIVDTGGSVLSAIKWVNGAINFATINAYNTGTYNGIESYVEPPTTAGSDIAENVVMSSVSRETSFSKLTLASHRDNPTTFNTAKLEVLSSGTGNSLTMTYIDSTFSRGLNVGTAINAGLGEVRASGGFHAPRSSGTARFGIDATTQGSQVRLVNNATSQIFGASANFSGLIIVNPTASTGVSGIFMVGGGSINLVGTSNSSVTVYSTTAGTASRINLYLDGSNIVTLENRWGATMTFNILALRTRASA